VAEQRNSGTLILQRPLDRPKEKKKAGEACIILLHPPGPDIGRRTPLRDESYVVGRDTEADLVISRSSVSRQHSRLVRDLEAQWWVEDLGSTNGTFVNEVRVTRQMLVDGDQVRFGDAIFKFLSGTNIESAYHEEIYRMTILDGLTGVHNKRYFIEFLERELASSSRHGHPITLVLFDIDHFKRVNDDRGHLAGDHVLKEMCNRIKPRIRREDLFARYGGEEFAAILTVTALEGGVRFAEHIRRICESQEFLFDGESFPVTVSLGVTAAFNEEVSPGEIIKRADENLYKAKRRGRNQVVPSLSDLGKVSET
jgi:diguanylate cyclase (GGDEF)-like protein